MASAPPRIGLAAIGGAGWMGGSNYVRNLAAAIRAVTPEAHLAWICGGTLLQDFQDVAPRWPLTPPTKWERWLRREKAGFRRLLERAGIEFLYPLTYDNTFNLGLNFPVRRALGRCDWAGWIPDFQHRYLPELFSPAERQWRESQIPLLVREAPRVVLSSESARADFERFFPESKEKAFVLPFRAAPLPPAEDVDELGAAPERFFLVCNQFWRHKNHLVVFEALRLLRARGLRPPLLCTGELSDYRGDEYVQTLRRLLQEDGLAEQVHLLGLIPRARQVALLRRAVAVIQPSLFEGWSTVIEDLRVLGRPSLLSDLPVHREQNPPGAHFFPASSAEALADLMENAWREWPGGRDPAREELAYRTALEQQRSFGEAFLALVESIRRK